jgi:hypothetical protein
MRSGLAVLALLLASAAQADSDLLSPAGEVMTMPTRAGQVEASVEQTRPARVVVRVDGRTVGHVEGVSGVGDIGIYDDEGGTSFALIEARAAGSSCFRRYLLVELRLGRAPRASPVFGTCDEVDRAVARRGRFVAWIGGRPYVKGATAGRIDYRVETRYVWSQGRLTAAVAKSRPWPPPR